MAPHQTWSFTAGRLTGNCVHCQVPMTCPLHPNDGIGQDGLSRGIKVLLGQLSLHGLKAQNHQSIAIFGTSVQLQLGQKKLQEIRSQMSQNVPKCPKYTSNLGFKHLDRQETSASLLRQSGCQAPDLSKSQSSQTFGRWPGLFLQFLLVDWLPGYGKLGD